EADDDDLPARKSCSKSAIAKVGQDDGKDAGQHFAPVAIELISALVGSVDQGGERQIEAAVGVRLLAGQGLHGGRLGGNLGEGSGIDVGLRRERGCGGGIEM